MSAPNPAALHEVAARPIPVPARPNIEAGTQQQSKRWLFGPGHPLMALGLAGMGALSLLSGDFAYTWQPVPMWVPAREFLAYASGAFLLVVGLGTLVRRVADISALVMTIFLLGWVLVLQSPRVAHAPGNVGMWLGLSESLLLMCGSWILFASLTGPGSGLGDKSSLQFITGEGGIRLARRLVGFSCVFFGISHFVYLQGTAGMVPGWLPYHTGLAYLTGAGHLSAGAALLFGVLPRLAATCEAIMISLFVLLLHLPGVISTPGSRLSWTMLFVASALAGAAWNTATSFRKTWSRRSP